MAKFEKWRPSPAPPRSLGEAEHLRTELFIAVQRALLAKGRSEEQAFYMARAKERIDRLPAISLWFEEEVRRLQYECPRVLIGGAEQFLVPRPELVQLAEELAAYTKEPKGE